MGKKTGNNPIGETLEELYSVLMKRRETMDDASYVALLYKKGEDSILKKVGEEASELIIASKGSDREKVVYEMVDLWFHCMVLMAHKGLTLDEISEEFRRRMGTSGLEEKASRKGD